jgi:hypothetical protein
MENTHLKVDGVPRACALFYYGNDVLRMPIEYIEMANFVAAEEGLERGVIIAAKKADNATDAGHSAMKLPHLACEAMRRV